MKSMKRSNRSPKKGSMFAENKQYIADAFTVFSPPEKITVAEWADKYRVLDEKSSAAPGKWNTERTPYLRRIMDEFCNPEIEEITFCAGSQIGKTEAEYNMLCFAIDQDPGPVLVVYPTDKLAEFASENRLEPMFRLSPAICDKFDKRASEKLELQFTNNYVALIGANSPSNLASRPVRYIFFDEIDKYPKWSGDEASPISLAEERQKTFYNKKTVKVSTPTTKQGNIWQAYEKSDLKLKYHVPCPHCGTQQRLDFKQIKWPKELRDPQLVRYAAWYECSHCSQQIDDRHKMEMLRSGDWLPENTPAGRVRSVGFHLSSLYSPWLTFGDVAAKFLASKETPEDLMNFINSWLAEPWEQKTNRMKSDVVLAKQWTHERARVPEHAQIITLGADVQLNHFWWIVRAWGAGLTSWLVDYGRCETWAELEHILDRNYITTLGEIMQINLACIDSGYNADEVYTFCAKRQDVCLPTKGSSNPLRARYNITILEKGVGAGLRLYIHDSGQMKDFIAGRLTLEPGTKGAWHVFKDCDREYADQICAEQKVEVKNGTRISYEWQPISSHAQNHLLDAEVNATLAAEILGVRYLVEEEEQSPPPIEKPAASGFVQRQRNWLRR
ncbi:hypothetical protein SDC9_04149 [bioreactor metagenome]|uniref:Phage terminase large subunit (GpA) n=1 Tax=bioreactor metagenome TaxID=1076179 RepID=A0A644SVF8_9ZZZZ|nr:phage terminase large subunit family protein [Negativicutes bacterium]